MKDVFVVSDNIISPVGNTTAENFHALKQWHLRHKGQHTLRTVAMQPFYASLLSSEMYEGMSDRR